MGLLTEPGRFAGPSLHLDSVILFRNIAQPFPSRSFLYCRMPIPRSWTLCTAPRQRSWPELGAWDMCSGAWACLGWSSVRRSRSRGGRLRGSSTDTGRWAYPGERLPGV